MCIMCLEIEKERMSAEECRRNWGEHRSAVVESEGEAHAAEVDDKVKDYVTEKVEHDSEVWAKHCFKALKQPASDSDKVMEAMREQARNWFVDAE